MKNSNQVELYHLRIEERIHMDDDIAGDSKAYFNIKRKFLYILMKFLYSCYESKKKGTFRFPYFYFLIFLFPKKDSQLHLESKFY